MMISCSSFALTQGSKSQGREKFYCKNYEKLRYLTQTHYAINRKLASFLMAEFKHGFGLTLRFSCFANKIFQCPEADRNSLILIYLF